MTRTQKVLDVCKAAPNEAVLIHKPSNIFYLSGYTGEGILIFGNGFKTIITDFRYTEQAERQAPGFDVRMVEKKIRHTDIAYSVFKEHGVDTVLFEDDEVTVKAFEDIKKAMPGMVFRSLDRVPEKVREDKDADEIAAIEAACDISCKAFEAFLPCVKPGVSEKKLQILLDNAMLEAGADAMAFDTIVASGENGSLPHAIPGQRVVRKGDMITFDFGAKKNGYCADMTRTVAVGEPSPEMRRIYDVVYEAQQASENALAAGRVCSDIDAIARKIIDDAGYQGRFGHGLGHSVGIDIHENPRLSMYCADVLREGIIMTVEPGIYVPGLGGVRIENTCVVTGDGARTLVHAQKELLIL